MNIDQQIQTGKNPDLRSKKYIECSMFDEGMINYYYYVTKMPDAQVVFASVTFNLMVVTFRQFEPSLRRPKTASLQIGIQFR